MVRGYRAPEAVRLEAEGPDLGAAEGAEAREALLGGGVDAEVHGG
jgi:hypothetical protein